LLEADPAHGRAVIKAPLGTDDAFLVSMRRGDFSSPGKHIGCNGYITNIIKKLRKEGMQEETGKESVNNKEKRG
jgi:hypothetical protein